MALFGLFNKQKKESLDKGLEKTREGFFSKLTKAVFGKSTVDDSVLDNLEEILVSSDVGVETTLKIVNRVQERVAKDKYSGTSELNNILREEIAALMSENNSSGKNDFKTLEDLPPGMNPPCFLRFSARSIGLKMIDV